MTLDQFQYMTVILNQFLDDLSPIYVIPMESDVVHKLTDKRRKMPTKKNLGIFK